MMPTERHFVYTSGNLRRSFIYLVSCRRRCDSIQDVKFSCLLKNKLRCFKSSEFVVFLKCDTNERNSDGFGRHSSLSVVMMM